jgi:hypothetical protein
MSKLDPRDAVWYVEAKDAHGVVVSAGSAVAVRLKKSDGQSFAETYLLTCVHVVRRFVGNESHYGDILSKLEGYRPGVGYNPAQAVQLTIVDEMIEKLPTDPGDAANDWVLLRINNDQTASASPAIDRWGDSSNCRVKICGYPGGTGSFVYSVVKPTETPDECPFESHDLGVLQFVGDGSRRGMSGGGVFEVGSQQFLGLHRAKRDSVLRLYAIAATYIFQRLGEMGYAPQIPDGSTAPSNSNDFFREQIETLLDGNKELAKVWYDELFPRDKEIKATFIADHLIIRNSTSKDEFPLRRFKRVLGNLVDKRTELNKECYQTLSLMKEILEIASCPAEDSHRIEKAMQEILRNDLGTQTGSEVTANKVYTSKNEDAKKLLIATRIKLLSTEFRDLNVAQLFNRDVTDNKDFRLVSRKIHVVSDPGLKPDDMTPIEFYSKACIDDLGYPHEGPRYHDELQDILHEMGVSGKVLSLLLSNEKTDAIKQLRQRFPSLLIVELPRESIGRYTAIVRDRIDVEKHLQELCVTAHLKK